MFALQGLPVPLRPSRIAELSAIGRAQRSPACQLWTWLRDCPWDQARSADMGDLERAGEQILRVGTQLVAAARRVADDDLLPADAVCVVAVGVRDVAAGSQPRAAHAARYSARRDSVKPRSCSVIMSTR